MSEDISIPYYNPETNNVSDIVKAVDNMFKLLSSNFKQKYEPQNKPASYDPLSFPSSSPKVELPTMELTKFPDSSGTYGTYGWAIEGENIKVTLPNGESKTYEPYSVLYYPNEKLTVFNNKITGLSNYTKVEGVYVYVGVWNNKVKIRVRNQNSSDEYASVKTWLVDLSNGTCSLWSLTQVEKSSTILTRYIITRIGGRRVRMYMADVYERSDTEWLIVVKNDNKIYTANVDSYDITSFTEPECTPQQTDQYACGDDKIRVPSYGKVIPPIHKKDGEKSESEIYYRNGSGDGIFCRGDRYWVGSKYLGVENGVCKTLTSTIVDKYYKDNVVFNACKFDSECVNNISTKVGEISAKSVTRVYTTSLTAESNVTLEDAENILFDLSSENPKISFVKNS